MNYKEYLNKIPNEIKPFCYFVGDTTVLKNAVLKKLTSEFVDESMQDFDIERLGKDAQLFDIMNACSTFSMLSTRRIIIVEELTESVSLFKTQASQLAKYISSLNDNVLLIFDFLSTPRSDSVVYKTVLSLGDRIECSVDDVEDLYKWVTRECKKNELTISAHDRAYLVDACDKDITTLNNVFYKLVDYCKSKPHGNNQVISQGDIDNNITFSAEIKVFELINSISQKKRSESIKLYKRLAANGESPLFIFNLIEKQISMMLLYLDGEASGKRKEEIMESLSPIKPFVFNKLTTQAKNFSREECVRALRLALYYDNAIKNGLINEYTALELFIAKTCAKE